MTPVLTETTTTCVVCGEVACERDLLYIDTPKEAIAYGGKVGDTVCRECAADED